MTTSAAAGIASLRDDSLPPLSVPMRFFATAPCFLVLLGGIWIGSGADALAGRWTPAVLAGTHLLTLGFFTMVMFGALFQVIPVLGGRPLPRPRLLGGTVHAALTGGALALSRGLWDASRPWLTAALLLLGAAFGLFLPFAARSLVPRTAKALWPVRGAAAGAAVTVALGVTMLAALAFPEFATPSHRWTDTHASWGGLGWGLLLVIGVGYQVIPMFHVTPPYPEVAVRWTWRVLLVGLLMRTLPGPWSRLGTAIACASGLAHVAVTQALLLARRRRRLDATVFGWQCGLTAVAVALLLVLVDSSVPSIMRPRNFIPHFDLFVASLFALGGLGTIVLGMLTKIVAFLSFLHLQRLSVPSLDAMREIPPMEDLLGQRDAIRLVRLHLAAATAAVAAVLLPGLGRAAGILLVLDGAFCLALLLRAAKAYRTTRATVESVLAAGAPGERL